MEVKSNSKIYIKISYFFNKLIFYFIASPQAISWLELPNQLI